MDNQWVSPYWQAINLRRRCDVGGVNVRALSVWHVFALEQLGNAFLVGGEISMDDVAALLIIASPLIMRRAMLRFRRKIIRADLPLEDWTALCTDYISAYLRVPRRWKKNSSGKAAGVQYQYHIVRVLCASYQMRLVEAWDTPLAYARCLYDAWAEGEQGDDSCMRPEHERIDDAMFEDAQKAETK